MQPPPFSMQQPGFQMPMSMMQTPQQTQGTGAQKYLNIAEAEKGCCGAGIPDICGPPIWIAARCSPSARYVRSRANELTGTPRMQECVCLHPHPEPCVAHCQRSHDCCRVLCHKHPGLRVRRAADSRMVHPRPPQEQGEVQRRHAKACPARLQNSPALPPRARLPYVLIVNFFFQAVGIGASHPRRTPRVQRPHVS
jgi:hypothetical protein